MSGMESPENSQLIKEWYGLFEVDGISYPSDGGIGVFSRSMISIHYDYYPSSTENSPRFAPQPYRHIPENIVCEVCWMGWGVVHDERQCTDAENDCCGVWLHASRFIGKAWYDGVRAQHERILKWTLDLGRR